MELMKRCDITIIDNLSHQVDVKTIFHVMDYSRVQSTRISPPMYEDLLEWFEPRMSQEYEFEWKQEVEMLHLSSIPAPFSIRESGEYGRYMYRPGIKGDHERLKSWKILSPIS